MPSRYDALAAHLAAQEDDAVTLSFDIVEAIIDGPLPASARRHRAWWGNDLGPGRQSRGWRSVGWLVGTVRLDQGLVTFHKHEAPAPRTEEPSRQSVTKLIVAIDDLRESVDKLTDSITRTLRD